MKLYYSRGACSLAVHIIINEIGVDCEYVAVDLKTKKTAGDKDYLTLNPKGAVPALELDNQQILSENLIIQQYLVDQYKATNLCPPIGDIQRYIVLGWSNYISTEVHKTMGALFNPLITQEMRENIFIPMIKKKFAYLDAQLGKQAYLSGKDFAMPDAYFFVMLLWAHNMKIELSEFANLQGYFAKLAERPSIAKSLEEEGIALAKG